MASSSSDSLVNGYDAREWQKVDMQCARLNQDDSEDDLNSDVLVEGQLVKRYKTLGAPPKDMVGKEIDWHGKYGNEWFPEAETPKFMQYIKRGDEAAISMELNTRQKEQPPAQTQSQQRTPQTASDQPVTAQQENSDKQRKSQSEPKTDNDY